MRSTTLLVGLAVAFTAGVAFAQNNSTTRQGIGAGGASIGAPDAAGGSVSSGTSNARGDVSPMGAGATAAGGSTQLYAVVNEDGTTARGKGDVSSQMAGIGAYRVRFARNVRNCAYTATIGLTGAFGSSAPGFITVVGDAFATNGVYLTTHDVTGDPAPRSFHLYVDC